jgi:hypothetical protein
MIPSQVWLVIAPQHTPSLHAPTKPPRVPGDDHPKRPAPVSKFLYHEKFKATDVYASKWFIHSYAGTIYSSIVRTFSPLARQKVKHAQEGMAAFLEKRSVCWSGR